MRTHDKRRSCGSAWGKVKTGFWSPIFPSSNRVALFSNNIIYRALCSLSPLLSCCDRPSTFHFGFQVAIDIAGQCYPSGHLRFRWHVVCSPWWSCSPWWFNTLHLKIFDSCHNLHVFRKREHMHYQCYNWKASNQSPDHSVRLVAAIRWAAIVLISYNIREWPNLPLHKSPMTRITS